MNLAFMLKVEGKIKDRKVSRNLPDNPFMEFPIEKNKKNIYTYTFMSQKG